MTKSKRYGSDDIDSSCTDTGVHEPDEWRSSLIELAARLSAVETQLAELKSMFGASTTGGVKPAESPEGNGTPVTPKPRVPAVVPELHDGEVSLEPGQTLKVSARDADSVTSQNNER